VLTHGRIVVAGAGLAGLRAVETLREGGFAGGIVVVGNELIIATGSRAVIPHIEVFGRQKLDAFEVTLTNGKSIKSDVVVLATGDAARWEHPDYDAPIRIEHWTNAGEQAVATASALLDPDNALPLQPLLSFWTDQYGQRLQAIGAPWLGSEIVFTKGAAGDAKFVAVSLSGGRVIGAVAMNMPAGLLECRTRMGAEYG
jgi:3-phenylpropionate/trans-cinnamate dioxygenase ferredoxin reductase component